MSSISAVEMRRLEVEAGVSAEILRSPLPSKPVFLPVADASVAYFETRVLLIELFRDSNIERLVALARCNSDAVESQLSPRSARNGRFDAYMAVPFGKRAMYIPQDEVYRMVDELAERVEQMLVAQRKRNGKDVVAALQRMRLLLDGNDAAVGKAYRFGLCRILRDSVITSPIVRRKKGIIGALKRASGRSRALTK